MAGNIEITTNISKANAAFGLIGKEIDQETKDLVRRIAGDMRDALKRNVPFKTGNTRDAVSLFDMSTGRTGAMKSFEPGDTYNIGVGFRRLPQIRGLFTKQPLAYVYAQNYGDTTIGRMHIPGEDPQRPGFDLPGNFGFWIKKRTLKPLHFIEESVEETYAQLDIEAAKFMRSSLIR